MHAVVIYGYESSSSSSSSEVVVEGQKPSSSPSRSLSFRILSRTMQAPQSTVDIDGLITVVPLKLDLTGTTPHVVQFPPGATPAGFTSEDLVELNNLSRVLLSNPQMVFPPPPIPAANQRSQMVAKAKDEGNNFFRKGEWAEAIRHYTLSADLAATRPVFEPNVFARDELAITLCNRSAAYLSAGQYLEALIDANVVIDLKKPWVKGYFRKGKALAGMGRLDEAKEALLLGLQFDPSAEVSPILVLPETQADPPATGLDHSSKGDR